MTIWLLALILLGLGGAIGRNIGAIRVLIGTVGVVIAAKLALPLGMVVKKYLIQFGLINPLLRLALPPVLVFVVVVIVFYVIAQIVHDRVTLYYKYKVEDEKWVAWDRLNDMLGASLGVVSGVIYLLVSCSLIHAVGYLTVQFEPARNNPTTLELLNRARADLRSTGMERMAAALDPVPLNYYYSVDILGLLYHNPELRDRLGDYPLFLNLSETSEYQYVIHDPEFNRILQSKLDLLTLVNNTNLSRLFKSPVVSHTLDYIDPKDLFDYLQTGKSLKYADQPVLGRWELHIQATIVECGQHFPRVGNWALDWAKFKTGASNELAAITMQASADGTLILNAQHEDFPQLLALLGGKLPTEAPPAAPANGGGGTPVPPGPKTIAKGSWKVDGDSIKIHLKADNLEKDGTLKMLKEDSLTIELPDGKMTFVKLE